MCRHNYLLAKFELRYVWFCGLFTARCYAERGIATASRLSVRPSVTLMFRDHMRWNSSKMIPR